MQDSAEKTAFITEKVTEKLSLSKERATVIAEELAVGFSPEKWARSLIIHNIKDDSWGKLADLGEPPEDKLTPKGTALAEALATLQGSEVFMDEVMILALKQVREGGGAWANLDTSNLGASARFLVVDGLIQGMKSQNFLTVEEASKLVIDPDRPEDRLQLIGRILADAHSAETGFNSVYERNFENFDNEGVKALAGYRQSIEEMKVTSPPDIVKDLCIKPNCGKPGA